MFSPISSKQATPIWSCAKQECDSDDVNVKLGAYIGGGDEGKVYKDAENPGFLIKKFEILDEKAIDEARSFNKFYGDGAAEVIQGKDRYYIRMYEVPGTPLSTIHKGTLPVSAIESFEMMLSHLLECNIIHGDLNENNVLYDHHENKFWPIDFSVQYEELDHNQKAYEDFSNEDEIQDLSKFVMDLIVPIQIY